MVCRDFILPEFCKPCLFLSSIQFAQLILHYQEIGPAPSFEVKKIGQDLPMRFGRSCFLLVTKTAGSVSGGAPQKSFSSSIERSEMLIADLAVWEISR